MAAHAGPPLPGARHPAAARTGDDPAAQVLRQDRLRGGGLPRRDRPQPLRAAGPQRRVPRRLLPRLRHDRLPAAVAAAARRHLPGDLRHRAEPAVLRRGHQAAGDRRRHRPRVPVRRGAAQPRRRAPPRPPGVARHPLQPVLDLRRGDPRPDRPDRRRPRPRGGPARRLRPSRPLGGHAGARDLRQAGRRAAAPRRPAGDRRRPPAPRAALRGRGRRRRLRVLRRAVPHPRLGQVATAPGERPVRARGRDVAGHHRPALDRPRHPRGSLVAARPPVDPCARRRGRARAARRA